MKNQKETVSFVLIGYQENIADFIGRLKYAEFLNSYAFSEKDQFEFTSNNIPPQEFLEQIRNQFPVRIFVSSDNTFVVKYVLPESKLIIEKSDFEEGKFNEFELLCEKIVQKNKIRNAKALGLNFSIVYDLDYKLRLFNSQIDKLTNWENNTGFSISIPLGIADNLTANYRIEKLNEKIEDNKKIRTYKTFVNYNFILNNSNNVDFSEILANRKVELYNLFKQNQKIIETIGQQTND